MSFILSVVTNWGVSMLQDFTIYQNDFLVSQEIQGYYHQIYTGYEKNGNPDFLNYLKNTFDEKPIRTLDDARNQVVDILIEDIPAVMERSQLTNCVLIGVPRAKALDSYSSNQLKLIESYKMAALRIDGVIDGTSYIKRICDTKTTHLLSAKKLVNEGEEPYPGITSETCKLFRGGIENKDIILVDDIYTRGVNTDEDCIEALLQNGANSVVFFAIGYARRNL